MNMDQRDIGFSFQEAGTKSLRSQEKSNTGSYVLIIGMALVIAALGFLTFMA